MGVKASKPIDHRVIVHFTITQNEDEDPFVRVKLIVDDVILKAKCLKYERDSNNAFEYKTEDLVANDPKIVAANAKRY